MRKIQVIMGTTRKTRFADQPANWIVEKIKQEQDVEVELIDLRDWQLPFFEESVSPSMNGGKYENELARKWADKIGEADGYIFVTAEYNHGYPAVLKNAIDYVYKEWNNKPVGFVAYGSVGGARSIEQLRQVVAEVQMTSIRAAVYIPAYWTLLDENGKLKTDTLEDNAQTMISQLLWWIDALKTARNK